MNDKQEEEKILRSFFVHYDGYNAKMNTGEAFQQQRPEPSVLEAKVRELYHQVQDE